MKEFTVSQSEAGKRLDKYIAGIIKNAPASFCYKMLRKKNIVLNGKKATGSEALNCGDVITFYLSDETFDKFSARSQSVSGLTHLMPPVVYEDEDVLIVNKPSGMLTQRSSANDTSLNEICLSYLYDKGSIDDKSLMTFVPSVCNRLDRNTSGLVTFGKTYKGAKTLADHFKKRTVHKFYGCIAYGIIKEDLELKGSLVKDADTNTVTVSDDDKDGAFIHTKIHPVRAGYDITLCDVCLITGKTHQIRAHLAHIGHAIIGDYKYGNRKVNDAFKAKYGIDSQLLACYKMLFPDDTALGPLAGKSVTCDLPDIFEKVM